MNTRSKFLTEIAKINFPVTEVSHMIWCNACFCIMEKHLANKTLEPFS